MPGLGDRLLALEIRFEEVIRRVADAEDWQKWVARGVAGLLLAAAGGRFVAWLVRS